MIAAISAPAAITIGVVLGSVAAFCSWPIGRGK